MARSANTLELSPKHRIAGVLVPIFSLRSERDQGIGDTECLIEFIDWAEKIGFGLVKTLPVNETGLDNSPYNAISSIALDPCLLRVTPEAVSDLSQEDYERIALEMPSEGLGPDRVHYQTVKTHKLELLKAAFASFLARAELNPASGNPLVVFASENADWIEDYALFRALCDTNGPDWTRWPSHFTSPRSARRYLADRVGLNSAIERNIAFYKYVQWQAALQWEKVHNHAAQRGVALMGDIPFGVNYYSADVWAERDLFLADWSGGTPPDGFFAHDEVIRTIGQNWGIPLYNWDQMRGDDFRWWRRRVRLNRRYFDLLRIDHVLGCYRIYGFPWRPERNREFLGLTSAEIAERNSGRAPKFFPASDDDPVDAAQNRASGEVLLRALLDESGPHRLIGEDLGFLPPYVRESLETLGIAGYRIPQWEKTAEGALADGTSYPRLSLAMYGTHDHDPLKSVWRTMAEAWSGGATDSGSEFEAFCAYANIAPPPDARFSAEVHTALLAALFASNAWIAVLQIADVFGWEDRINLPGTSNDENWTCRLPSPITSLHLEGTAPDVSNLILRSGRSRPQDRTRGGFT
ncbi:MAG: 4-alpha-glucanotransferase [Betaproteobacteria bacterium]|nr:4-alpha-glucanotransferase [Betaproteobacteria bacterium]